MKQIPMLDVEPKFILEIASGLREPSDLAAEYGYTPEEWLFLREYEPFKKQVEAKKAELKASGYTFRMKAAIAAEDLLADVYKKAKQDDASFHTQLETVKFMARAAGLETPPKAEVETGPGFSITINLSGGQSVKIESGARQGEVRPTADVEIDGECLDVIDSAALAALPGYTPTGLVETPWQE